MKYTKELLEEAAARSFSIAGVLRELGIAWAGGTHAHISRRLKALEVDTSHFTGSAHSRGGHAPNRHPPEQILIARPPLSRRAETKRLRRALLEIGVAHACAECGIDAVWRGKPLILHVDHINGDHCDSRRENLRFLCPNCHTQTFNYAGRSSNRRATQSGSDQPAQPG